MFNNEIEFELNLNEKKTLEKKTKEKQNKRKNSKGRYNLQHKIKLIKSNINLNDNNISSKNKKRIRNIEKVEDFEKIEKKKKTNSIVQMMERINLDTKYDYSQLKYNDIEKRKLKSFGDISSSKISKNLFNNYYPSIIPSYCTNQIKSQIITNQIDKMTTKFDLIRKLNNNEISKKENKKLEKFKIHKSYKINNNNFINTNYKNKNIISNSIRELLEKNNKYMNEYDYDELKKKEELNEYEYDSNNENNSKNTYQEEERSISEEAYNGDIENNSFDDGENYYDYIPNDDKIDSREYNYFNYKKQYRDN